MPKIEKKSGPEIVKGRTFKTKRQDDDEDIKGVHTESKTSGIDRLNDKGMSVAGHQHRVGSRLAKLSTSDAQEAGHDQMESAKAKHAKKLEEMQDLPAPKLKGLADGGEVQSDDQASTESKKDEPSMWQEMKHKGWLGTPAQQEEDERRLKQIEVPQGRMMAEGGEVNKDRKASLAAAMMAEEEQRLAEGGDIHIDINSHMDEDEDDAEMMAEGGQVDLSMNADEEPNNEDQMSFQALKKENYSESEGLEQLDSPKDSNMHGMARQDEHDEALMSLIRKRMKMKSPISE